MHVDDAFAEERDTPGWIAIADALLLTTIVLVGIAYGTANYSDSQRILIAELKTRVQELDEANAEISVLKDKELDLTNQIALLQKELAAARSTILALDDQIKNHSTEALVKERDELIAKVAQLESRESNLLAELKSLKADLTFARLEVLEHKDRLWAELAKSQSLANQVKLLTDSKLALQEQLDRAQKSVAMLEIELDLAKAQNELIGKKEAQLRKDLAAANLELKRLKLLAASLEEELIKANALIAKLEQEGKKNAIQLANYEDTDEKHALEIAKLKRALRLLEEERARYEVLLKQQNERIIKPLETAGLIVRIRTRNLPDDLDLDLYVQDPGDHLCYWKRPRVMTALSERAMLIPSEDLRASNVLLDDEQKGTMLDEVYYAAEPLMAPAERQPYLVFCMVRQIGTYDKDRSIEQEIEWEITVKNPDGQNKVITGKKTVNQTGAILVKGMKEWYPGILPLMGFEVRKSNRPEVRALADADLPKLPRGWSRTTQEKGAEDFKKLRDGTTK